MPVKSEVVTRGINDLSGPRTFPIAGNLIGLDMHALHFQLKYWCDQYGALFNIKQGPERFSSIADPEAILRVLKQRHDRFSRIKFIKPVLQEL